MIGEISMEISNILTIFVMKWNVYYNLFVIKNLDKNNNR
jgi:hypothetical protein